MLKKQTNKKAFKRKSMHLEYPLTECITAWMIAATQVHENGI